MNELIKVEENTLIVAERAIEQIKDFERKRKLIDEKEKNFKDQLLKAMEEHNIKSYESPDKTLKITYTPENIAMTFDSARFKEDHLDMYFDYQKETTRKASIRMTIREEESE